MLCSRKFPRAKNLMDQRRRGEYQAFPSKTFCLTVPKFSDGKTFSVSLISSIEEVWIRGGGGGSEYQAFPSKSFCLTVPKIFVEEPFCAAFQKISASEKIYG